MILPPNEPTVPVVPRSPRLSQLFEHLRLDDGVIGLLDWTSGVLQLNYPIEAYTSRAFDQFPAELASTLLHESYHAIQIAMLGYLYRFASTLDMLLARSFPDRIEDVDDFYRKVPTKFADEWMYHNIIRDLHRKVDGICVLDIVEGLTFCCQHRASVDYDTGRYVEFLKRSHVAGEYRNAFTYFAERVDGVCNAIMAFPVVAHLSLCSHSPPECFAILTAAYRAQHLKLRTDLPDIIAYCQQHDPDYRGFSWQFRDACGNPFPNHPHFGTVREFFINHPQGSELFSKYLLVPELLPAQEQVEAAFDVVIFKDRVDAHDPAFREWPMMVFPRGGPTRELRMARARGLQVRVAVARRMMRLASKPV